MACIWFIGCSIDFQVCATLCRWIGRSSAAAARVSSSTGEWLWYQWTRARYTSWCTARYTSCWYIMNPWGWGHCMNPCAVHRKDEQSRNTTHFFECMENHPLWNTIHFNPSDVCIICVMQLPPVISHPAICQQKGCMGQGRWLGFSSRLRQHYCF